MWWDVKLHHPTQVVLENIPRVLNLCQCLCARELLENIPSHCSSHDHGYEKRNIIWPRKVTLTRAEFCLESYETSMFHAYTCIDRRNTLDNFVEVGVTGASVLKAAVIVSIRKAEHPFSFPNRPCNHNPFFSAKMISFCTTIPYPAGHILV
jgi:hypothetical protein